MNKMITVKCPAKINLSLDVISRRDDGYHNLEMIMHTIRLYDVLQISVSHSDHTQIDISSNLGYLPTDNNNLCAKAAQLFLQRIDKAAKVTIDVKKNIPVGAGLGGGSADAAGTLAALNRLMNNPLTTAELAELAKNIGADVPFFLYGGCMLAEGIGEILSPLPKLCDVVFLIAKPNYGISTPFVYKNLTLDENTLHPDTKSVISALKQNDLTGLGRAAGNVLESVVVQKYPEIEQYKKIMLNHGAIYSLMSGSGSAVFGVFKDRFLARQAADKLKRITKQVYLA